MSQFADVLVKCGYIRMSHICPSEVRSEILRLQLQIVVLAPLPKCSLRGPLFVSVPSLQLALALEEVLIT